MLQRNIGSLDGGEMIKMNNLAVGYFPTDSPEIGVYPPPQPEPIEMENRFMNGEAANQLGVTKNTLYLWEKAGKIAPAKRYKRNNYRYYTTEDIAKIRDWMEATAPPSPEAT